MNKITWWAIILSTLAFSGCQSEPSAGQEEVSAEQPPLKEALPGTWESVSIRVDVNTAENTDSSYVFEVKEEEWAQRLGSRPIRFYFQPDNKYRQEFTALSGEIVSSTKGMWNTFGDTLMLIEPDATYQYLVTTGKGLAEFRTMMDWDGDGQEDDNYLGVHRRISIGVD